MSAPAARALSIQLMISREFPARSPTVGLIWARAILTTQFRSEERRVGKEGKTLRRLVEVEDGIRDTSVTGVQTCALPIYECRLEDEVLGRIAGDRQLRKADDVGARGARLVHPADDQPRISGQVTDGWVDLGESNPHNSILTAPSPPLGLVVPVAYFDRLRALSRERHTLLCVGLDPDPDRIEGGAAGALRHCRDVVRQTEEHVCCFKPNSAFWEQYGPDGWAALLELRDEAPDTPFLLDAKRGDMDNTMRAYARAVLGTLAKAAATVRPYLGSDPLPASPPAQPR